jgi:hypothetical protein
MLNKMSSLHSRPETGSQQQQRMQQQQNFNQEIALKLAMAGRQMSRRTRSESRTARSMSDGASPSSGGFTDRSRRAGQLLRYGYRFICS